MAIDYDASSVPSPPLVDGSTPQTLSWAHTCTGSERLLVVQAANFINTAVLVVTYNGVPMTEVSGSPSNVLVTGPSTYIYNHMFYLLGPATGSNTLSITHVWTTGDTDYVFGAAASYTGAAQTGQPDNVTTNSNTSTASLTTSLTTSANGCWVMLTGLVANTIETDGAGFTNRQSTGNGMFIGDSNAAVTPAGSYSMTQTCSPANPWAVVMASFAPYGSPPPSSTPGVLPWFAGGGMLAKRIYNNGWNRRRSGLILPDYSRSPLPALV